MSDLPLVIAFIFPFTVLLFVMLVGLVRSLRRKAIAPRLSIHQENYIDWLIRNTDKWPASLTELIRQRAEQYGFDPNNTFEAIKEWVVTRYTSDSRFEYNYGLVPKPDESEMAAPIPDENYPVVYGAQVWDSSEFRRYQKGNGQQ